MCAKTDRRRSCSSTSPKPISIIAHVTDSGTLETGSIVSTTFEASRKPYDSPPLATIVNVLVEEPVKLYGASVDPGMPGELVA